MRSSQRHQEFAPVEGLTDTIKCFWYDSRSFGAEHAAFEVMPDGYAEIIFHFGGSCSISNNGILQPLPSPFIVGLLNRPAVFYAKDKFEILAIRCFPWTVFDLLGLPAGKGKVHLFEHSITQLHPVLNSLIQAGKVDEAIICIKQYFLEVHSQIATNSMLYKAGIAMRAANGTMPVGQVAAAAHASVRTLERNFKQSSGHTVKDVSALMRFEQVRNHLWLYPDCSLAGLAAERGYTDQSHLSKEFKRYSGTTPAAFARKAKKARQAASDDFVVFLQS